MKVELEYAGKLSDFQREWGLVQADTDIEAVLDAIGIARDHPDFDDLNNYLLVKENEVSEGFIESVMSIQSNRPWAITAPVYKIMMSTGKKWFPKKRSYEHQE